MPSQISGQAPKPSKPMARPPRKPRVDIVAMGGSVAKSAGHAAHDVKHGIGKAVGKIGGIFG